MVYNDNEKIISTADSLLLKEVRCTTIIITDKNNDNTLLFIPMTIEFDTVKIENHIQNILPNSKITYYREYIYGKNNDMQTEVEHNQLFYTYLPKIKEGNNVDFIKEFATMSEYVQELIISITNEIVQKMKR